LDFSAVDFEVLDLNGVVVESIVLAFAVAGVVLALGFADVAN
jgi:hypothetical protein